MNPPRSNSSLPRPGRSAYGVATAVVLLLIPVVVLAGGDAVQAFLDFGAGVLSLVSLSCSVIWGLVAQDRVLLNIRQRIVAQAVHRTTAVASIAFLVVHITVKLALEHTVLIAALVPFSLGLSGSAGLIGLGSLAALLMIFVGVTGALRSNFASPAPVAARWRAMHMLAYPSWCAALVHGLFAGRPAKQFFMVSYELCLLGVMAALILRVAPRVIKRRLADQVFAIIGPGDQPGRDELDASRARNAEAAAAMTGLGARPGSRSGYDDRRPPGSPASPSSPYEASRAGTGPAESGPGFAAAYRATAPASPRPQGPPVDGPGSTSGSWPIPSPPPVGEAPPSAYDPLQDTSHSIPVQGDAGQTGYGASEMYNRGETSASPGAYTSNNMYNGGPATETMPGAYGTPGAGEPWNAPSGGFK
ncbi:cytochrome b/b6 domain-containing protein [Streptomyces nodosus]|uniref:cytochrome b/b6 domain-containing protein n=1 Tax=Streptomyces nodosus TaxID=40318 RepID=UPI0038272057